MDASSENYFCHLLYAATILYLKFMRQTQEIDRKIYPIFYSFQEMDFIRFDYQSICGRAPKVQRPIKSPTFKFILTFYQAADSNQDMLYILYGAIL